MEAMVEATLVLCDCPAERTGGVHVSLDLLDELGHHGDDARRLGAYPGGQRMVAAHDQTGVQEPRRLRRRGARRESRSSSATVGRCCRAVFDRDEVDEMKAEIDAAFVAYPAERSRGDKDEFRYEMFNRSAACQRAIARSPHPRGHRAAARRRLPRDRQHRVEEPARLQGRSVALRRGPARSPPRGRRVGRPHPVPGLRGRRAHHARRLPARRRPDRGHPRQPPLGTARAVRSHVRRGPHLRRSAAARVRGRAPATSCSSSPTSGTAGSRHARAVAAASSSRRTTPAATSRSGSTRPTHANQCSPEAIARADDPASAPSSASTTRSSTTADSEQASVQLGTRGAARCRPSEHATHVTGQQSR